MSSNIYDNDCSIIKQPVSTDEFRKEIDLLKEEIANLKKDKNNKNKIASKYLCVNRLETEIKSVYYKISGFNDYNVINNTKLNVIQEIKELHPNEDYGKQINLAIEAFQNNPNKYLKYLTIQDFKKVLLDNIPSNLYDKIKNHNDTLLIHLINDLYNTKNGKRINRGSGFHIFTEDIESAIDQLKISSKNSDWETYLILFMRRCM